MLSELRVREFMELLASKAPAPGGGSSAGLEGAQGAALVCMVCELTIGRKKYASVEPEMQEVLAQAQTLRDQLLELMERDARSYDAVMAAYQLPKDTPEQKERRSAAIQEGLKGATLVPMQTLEACVHVLRLAPVVVEKGNLNAVSDGGAGVLSAYAGMLTAAINVRINLNAIKDTAFVQEMEQKMQALVAEGEAAKAEAWQILQAKLGLDLKFE